MEKAKKNISLLIAKKSTKKYIHKCIIAKKKKKTRISSKNVKITYNGICGGKICLPGFLDEEKN